MTRNHCVSGRAVLLQAEAGGAMGSEGVELLEGTRVEEQVQPLAGSELSLGVLLLDAPPSPAETGLVSEVIQFLEPLV